MGGKNRTTTAQVDLLTKEAARAFTAVRAAYPEERFYFFALYTTEAGSYVSATAWSEEALSQVVADHKRDDPDRAVEALERDLRFSAPDSPYHDIQSDVFSSFEGGAALHEACFQALERLDRDGFFGSGDARTSVVVNVVYGDMSHERWLAHAQRLNPPSVVESVLPYLRLHLPSGPVSRWGANAYQVNALSLSRDRSLVAYSGSGGEVGVLRLADRRGIYEKRRNGEHWASVLSPDGTRLFLGDREGVGVLEPWTGKYTSFVKGSKPSKLALSPDGKRLAVSTWDEPLRVFDTATRHLLWKRDGVKNVTASFSPCGRWFATAASARVEGKTWAASVTCCEASTGRELWTTPLGNGSTASIAWSPDGEELLGAASESTYSPDGDRTGVASLAFLSAVNGGKVRCLPWTGGIDAVAVAPSGQRIALCSKAALVVLDRGGAELARGTGGQESLVDCAFVDDDTVLAVGRDVNSGPAILSLTVP